ncbi:dTDP-4-dehydrorhamnose reductase [Martelella endophytica]|uniref:dTDP-4-dehydrorhamnose reductase n=1 Tax=Martelella endophytica TaxID=1486262 RepID=A0A0D5LMS4_MAREN|nr:dTDP-4-dehydrorhamnose reductase [Martelella endophytica]AJY45431.1 dTDP-4-dehydrorhamnose reductase [Martelella endophytica]
MILVFGKTGQVALELQSILPEARFLSRAEADLADPEACAAAIADARPDAVINAAAYTAVDKAEDDEVTAQIINGEAPGAMARAAAARGIPFIHISTDYVFDGSGDTAFATDAPTAPIGAYGRTKLAGEEAVAASGAPHAIMRTSWVFSAHGGNFVKTMLRLSETRDTLNVVGDQIGGPTPARAIAAACKAMAEGLVAAPEKSGIYHFSGAPDVSWADFARAIFRRAGRNVTVNDIPTAEYPTPAKRPLNSRLDCASLAAFGLERPDWQAGLDDVLKELGATS